MIKFKFFAILLLPIIFLFSCKTTETIIIEDQYRLSSFSILDGSENLIQKVNITYNEMNKPAEIIAKGASGEVFNIKSMYYTNSGKLSNLNNSTDNSNYVKTE
jgi:hypothetical protein